MGHPSLASHVLSEANCLTLLVELVDQLAEGKDLKPITEVRIFSYAYHSYTLLLSELNVKSFLRHVCNVLHPFDNVGAMNFGVLAILVHVLLCNLLHDLGLSAKIIYFCVGDKVGSELVVK